MIIGYRYRKNTFNNSWDLFSEDEDRISHHVESFRKKKNLLKYLKDAGIKAAQYENYKVELTGKEEYYEDYTGE